MIPVTVSAAFSNAPPRSPCVLCARDTHGGAYLILTEWFTWLNMTRNPMLSFSMPRGAVELREGDGFTLAFPSAEEALLFKHAVKMEAGAPLPAGTVELASLPIPRGSVVALRCTLAGAYNYPFKKVRIFNCNLEDAFGAAEVYG